MTRINWLVLLCFKNGQLKNFSCHVLQNRFLVLVAVITKECVRRAALSGPTRTPRTRLGKTKLTDGTAMARRRGGGELLEEPLRFEDGEHEA